MTSDRGRVAFDLCSAPGRAADRLARERKGWCLAPNTPPDAPRMPACATALRASLPELAAPPMAGSSRPGHVEHEKNTFFSLLENSRSEDGGQGRAFSSAPRSGPAP